MWRGCGRIRWRVLVATLWLASSLGVGATDQTTDPIVGITVTQLVPLTGTDSINRTERVDVVGTDLGILTEVDGTIYIAFGDTFGYGKSHWRSNVFAYTTDVDPSDGIALDGWITDGLGDAQELVPGKKDRNDAGGEMTKIPTALIFVDGRLYMAFMSVRHWGPPGRWDANYATWAYSDDRGHTWHVLDPPMWPKESGFIMLAVSQEAGRGNREGYLRILATPAGRFGGVKAARVRPESVLDRSAYEYFGGTDAHGQPRWSGDPAGAVEVIPAPVGEGSLLWNPFLDRWVYTYLNEHSHNMELRSAPEPWAPWSEPHTLAEAAGYPALYGGFMTPSWVEDDGRVIYFLMSQFGPYNV